MHVCVWALTYDFILFFTHITLLIRKIPGRSASQAHMPEKSEVHLKEWMSEQSRSTSAWMGSLFGQALPLCWQENKSLIAPPCEGTHALCSHIPSGQMMMSAPRWPENSTELAWTRAPNGTNTYFLTSSCNSDECVGQHSTKTTVVFHPVFKWGRRFFLTVKGK